METLGTTNVMLGILAAMSVVQTLVVIVAAYGAWRAYQATTRLIEAKLAMVETTLVPSILKVEKLLANLERTAAVVRTRTENVDHAIDSARDVATQFGTVVWPKAAAVASVAGGVLGVVRRWRSGR